MPILIYFIVFLKKIDIIELAKNLHGGNFMEEKQTLGLFIARKRKEANMTQKELAEKLFVTESAVSKWERGISYPDITLVSAICETLKINEHELVTASEDKMQRKIEKDAKRFDNIRKTYKWTFYISYSIAIITCFICNLAIEHKLSWFFIVLTSIAVAFSLTSLSLILKKHTGIITLTAFFVSLTLLLLTCSIYTGGDWFWVTYTSITFGLLLIFLPFVLKAVTLPEKLSNHKALICFTVDTVLLLVNLATIMAYSGKFSVFIKFVFPITAISLIPIWLVMLIMRYEIIKQYKWVIIFSAFFISVTLLLLICSSYTGGDWFWVSYVPTVFGIALFILPFILKALPFPKILSNHKALIYFIINSGLLFLTVAVAMKYSGYFSDYTKIACPIIAISLAPAWLMMLTIRYLKINGFFRTSICMLICNVFLFFINSIIDTIIFDKPFEIMKINLSDWSDKYISGNVNFNVIMTSTVIAIIFIICGIAKEIKLKGKIIENK